MKPSRQEVADTFPAISPRTTFLPQVLEGSKYTSCAAYAAGDATMKVPLIDDQSQALIPLSVVRPDGQILTEQFVLREQVEVLTLISKIEFLARLEKPVYFTVMR